MLGIVALALLIISLLCRSQWRLRQWGLASALVFAVEYHSDNTLLATQLLIAVIHARWLYMNRANELRYIEIMKVN